MIYAEGTTSNNTHIMKFKRGAFASLRPVQPISLQYKCSQVSNSNCLKGDVFTVFMLCACFMPSVVTVKKYPVFVPNEKLYEKEPKKDKQDVYAEAVREMMCRETGLPKSNQSWREFKCYYENLADKVRGYF